MDTGERRIPPAVPLLAALIFAGGVALWPGGGDADGSAVQASAELSADELEVSTPPRVNSRSARLTEKVKGLIRGALGEAVALGAKREDVQVSVLVKELGVDGDLVEVDSDKSLKPASNMKLATTAAALALLGGEAMFETTVWANVAPADGQIAGDLVVRAGADPLFEAGLEGAVRPL
ncbi:MAG: D-alanyl-D-alanine carboxypeptidase, partial [Planctomycetes bacterium]|nr:D-alanyl-D-alanine carboxypeptidase [Planctomycetota bacterium]